MGPWSTADLERLAILAETFAAGGDVDGRATLAAIALAAVADPAQVREFRLALRAMDSRAANLALTGRPNRIGAMDANQRERYLLGWGTSRIAQRRAAFGVLRKLLLFLAYAPPAGTPPGPLAAFDYRPDDPPPPAEPPAIKPVDLAAIAGRLASDAPIELEADVVVVGSGAGGGVVAAALAAAGRSVCVLEAGPYVDERSMPRLEVEAFERLYLDRGLLSTWDGSITMLAGTGVGGGTLVNWTTSIPAPEAVRTEWASEHGLDEVVGERWETDVAVLEDELDIGPSTHIPPKDAVLLRGALALGWDAGPTRRNAGACGDCGSCPFGCRRGTKRSGMRAHLATAAVAGARIVPWVSVDRVLLRGGRVAGVQGVATVGDDEAPRRLVVHAPTVVVAAGATRSPAILVRSGLEHPAIGRHLRVHPTSVVAGWYDEPIEMWRGTMQAARSLEFVESNADRRGYVIESAPGHPGLLALALPWEGRAAHASLMTRAATLGPLIAVTRDGGEGRVTLTRAGRVRVDYRLDRLGVATLRHGLTSMARLAHAAGAHEIVAGGLPPSRYRADGTRPGSGETSFDRFVEQLAAADFSPHRTPVFSAHQLGSVRMGGEPAAYPCDPWGRVRSGPQGDVPIAGLYVGDGSLCPTGLGVNPMITIMALAKRVARTVLAES